MQKILKNTSIRFFYPFGVKTLVHNLILDQIIDSRFTIYVDGVQADAPSVLPASRGLPAYLRLAEREAAAESRRFLAACDPLVDATLLAHKIQFPELRLIEYDCGSFSRNCHYSLFGMRAVY